MLMSAARAILILLSALSAPLALADVNFQNYYPSSNSYGSGYSNSYYNSYSNSYSSSYSSRSRGSGPVYSLELDPQKSLNESMRVAAREERLHDVEEMISQGANVNSKSTDGQTALIYASRACNLDVVRVLLKHHAQINQVDSYGRTALMYSVMESCVPVTELLLNQRGVHISFVDDERFSVLDYAQQAAELDVDGPALTILNLIRKASGSSVALTPRP